MNKLLILFSTALLFSPATAATDEYVAADTNRDGYVNTADAELIYSYILGTADEDVTVEQVDVNSDGLVNTADVVAVYVELQKYMLTAITATPSALTLDYENPTQSIDVATTPATITQYVQQEWAAAGDEERTELISVSNGITVTAVILNDDGTLNLQLDGKAFNSWYTGATITLTIAWNGYTAQTSLVINTINAPMEGIGVDTYDDYEFGEKFYYKVLKQQK